MTSEINELLEQSIPSRVSPNIFKRDSSVRSFMIYISADFLDKYQFKLYYFLQTWLDFSFQDLEKFSMISSQELVSHLALFKLNIADTYEAEEK